MFDISWSELLILAIVTLVFVGPKELPVFLRTLGRYAGTVRRHANEFKAQFDAAMREAELDSMRQEVEQMQSSINSEVMRAKSSFGEVASAAHVELPVKVEVPPASAEPAASLAMPPLPATPAEMAAAEPTAAMTKSEP
jgi:sec-independent protein translocase protein TatB